MESRIIHVELVVGFKGVNVAGHWRNTETWERLYVCGRRGPSDGPIIKCRSGEVTKNKYFFCVLHWCRRVALADIKVLGRAAFD